ncbi:MAG: YfcE family phosphodiesterase [Tenericutes bacterium]|jgi:putative phosphoesterase|nr:YfcE family phosphodiesterase [Mycoplasmatota bacterium]
MKILVFSDTHGDVDAFNQMFDYEKNVEHIFCNGDSGFDLDFLEEKNVISVKGNYPFTPKLPFGISEKLKGHWFFFTHGHQYHVKFGLGRLINKADLLRMDVCCFGHTHKILLKKKKNLILLNPGALSYTRSHLFPSYARILLQENQIEIEIINLKTKEVVDKIIEVN